MNTAQLTPRALDVIAASDEYTAPIFRERPGEVAHILHGWRIEPDDEGVRVVSPSGDGCYVWDQDSRNAPTFMGICQREVFRQLCQTLAPAIAATAATGEAS